MSNLPSEIKYKKKKKKTKINCQKYYDKSKSKIIMISSEGRIFLFCRETKYCSFVTLSLVSTLCEYDSLSILVE